MVPGPISDIEGRTVGTHEGIARYTIGQRRGLGVAAGERRYVVRLDAGGNRVVLGSRSDLAVSTIDVESMNWVSVHEPTAGPVFVQYRSTMMAVPGSFRRVFTAEGGFASPLPSTVSRPGRPPSCTTGTASWAAARFSGLSPHPAFSPPRRGEGDGDEDPDPAPPSPAGEWRMDRLSLPSPRRGEG